MKIGILTWFWGMNYGARAHSNALYEFLNKKNYEVEMINYCPIKGRLGDLRACCSKNPILMLKGLLVFGYFAILKKENFNKSHRIRNASDIDKQKYDIVILGSDEIFNFGHKSFNPIYLGEKINNTRLISYAVSVGQLDFDFYSKKYEELLGRIDKIGVRDLYTQEYLKKQFNINSEIVLDPTLLIDDSDKSFFENFGRYVLIYSFGSLDSIKCELINYAKKNRLMIIRVGKSCKNDGWIDKIYPCLSQAEWRDSFRCAELVITDSFHGTVYSIKNNKNMVLLKKDDKINKIDCLLKQLEIKKNFFDNDIPLEKYILEEVDYSKYNWIISQKRSDSEKYIVKCLEAL